MFHLILGITILLVCQSESYQVLNNSLTRLITEAVNKDSHFCQTTLSLKDEHTVETLYTCTWPYECCERSVSQQGRGRAPAKCCGPTPEFWSTIVLVCAVSGVGCCSSYCVMYWLCCRAPPRQQQQQKPKRQGAHQCGAVKNDKNEQKPLLQTAPSKKYLKRQLNALINNSSRVAE